MSVLRRGSRGGGGWLGNENLKIKKTKQGDDLMSQPSGNIIEACKRGLSFPGCSGVQGSGSTWARAVGRGGVQGWSEGKLGGRERREE